ncbi:Aste57867_23723 [Aphanomyces stellatus]|uniref:Aste57867_23723 protein n=1 Tax=Aphanomyces stellatus TaxID=120398 RepID=A0A485LP91_9STRA|nr:hypothetical protein As57867_023651 [Aphanomyces stellatus]VFU00368.1 Aste57867_23723 [Aphanomyces stellatus]
MPADVPNIAAASAQWEDDLRFLFASDNGLQEELDNVCDLFQDSPPSDATDESCAHEDEIVSSPTPVVCTKRKAKSGSSTHTYTRQRQEIQQLRDEVKRLQERIASRQADARTASSTLSLWARTASAESAGKHQALQENERLKEAVAENATFIEAMEKVMRKKPRLTTHARDMHSEEWQAYTLAAHASLRVAAIHAIADRQLRRLQTAFVQAGIWDQPQDVFVIRGHPANSRRSSFLVESIHHMTLAAPFRVVGAVAWQVFEGEAPPDLPEGALETFERVDPFTVYGKTQTSPAAPTLPPGHSNMIRKYYVEPDREVIVSRTVLEDATMPHMSKGAVENRCMWLTVVPVDAHRCRFSFVQHSVWPATTDVDAADMDHVVQTMQRMCFAPPPATGLLPSTLDQDTSDNLGMFAERGRRFVRTLKRLVNDAVQAYDDRLSTDERAIVVGL